jgi:hypothetical protein
MISNRQEFILLEQPGRAVFLLHRNGPLLAEAV